MFRLPHFHDTIRSCGLDKRGCLEIRAKSVATKSQSSRLPDGSNSIPEPSKPILSFHRSRFHFSRLRGTAKNDCSIFTPLPIVSRADVPFFTASRCRKNDCSIFTPPPIVSRAEIPFSTTSRCRKNDCGIFTPLPIVSRAEIPFSTSSRRLKIDFESQVFVQPSRIGLNRLITW